MDFLLAKPVFEFTIAVSTVHLAIAIRAKMLLFAIYLPGEVFLFKSSTANITSPWFKYSCDDHKDNDANNPFHNILLFKLPNQTGDILL